MCNIFPRLVVSSWRPWSSVSGCLASTIQTPSSNMWVFLEKHLNVSWRAWFLLFVLNIQALLGVYAYAGGEAVLAQKCFLRARLLTLTIHGEDHPYIATLDVSYNLTYTATTDTSQSLSVYIHSSSILNILISTNINDIVLYFTGKN